MLRKLFIVLLLGFTLLFPFFLIFIVGNSLEGDIDPASIMRGIFVMIFGLFLFSGYIYVKLRKNPSTYPGQPQNVRAESLPTRIHVFEYFCTFVGFLLWFIFWGLSIQLIANHIPDENLYSSILAVVSLPWFLYFGNHIPRFIHNSYKPTKETRILLLTVLPTLFVLLFGILYALIFPVK